MIRGMLGVEMVVDEREDVVGVGEVTMVWVAVGVKVTGNNGGNDWHDCLEIKVSGRGILAG